ncbi:MAG: oxygen-independent coproporphyrinogen-3 oxidase [Pirellulaceae bacterium]|jgi:oxygen-independent coproporphyrinogen-3 oxidase
MNGRESKATSQRQPVAAYVHVPFCRHRCGYCNFTLVAGRDDLIESYLQAIELELQTLQSPHAVETLFLGGGTPSHLSASQLNRLFNLLEKWFPLGENAEVSVEVNPADIDKAKANVLAECGVTRISIGGQSFDEQRLKLLERDHTPQQIRDVVFTLRPIVKSISLDLIFGVPDCTLEAWEKDLDETLSLPIDHVSTYGLTFEKGTSFWTRQHHGELAAVDEGIERQMYASAIDRLTANGIEHYEVSNFGRTGHRCRHNETYWRGEQFWAVGPGAARFIGGRREVNHRSTTTYIKKMLAGESPIAEVETLSAEASARERFIFAMRRLAGVSRSWFREVSGFEIDELFSDALPRHVADGWLQDDGETIALTREGLYISDALWVDYV